MENKAIIDIICNLIEKNDVNYTKIQLNKLSKFYSLKLMYEDKEKLYFISFILSYYLEQYNDIKSFCCYAFECIRTNQTNMLSFYLDNINIRTYFRNNSEQIKLIIEFIQNLN